MVYVLVRHGVEDYAKWKAAFDEHGSLREQYGSQGGWLFRSEDDPNQLSILLNYEDTARAREFAESSDLKEAMEQAGVKGAPEIHFLEQLEEVPL